MLMAKILVLRWVSMLAVLVAVYIYIFGEFA